MPSSKLIKKYIKTAIFKTIFGVHDISKAPSMVNLIWLAIHLVDFAAFFKFVVEMVCDRK